MEKTRTKKWKTFVAVLVVVIVGLFIYLGYKEPVVEINSNALKLKGVYGVNLMFSEIAEADTISWNEVPEIAIRSNGISLGEVQRGYFKTTDNEKVHLSIHSGVNPVIRIVEQDGSVYYINRKNAEETRQIFNKLNINTAK